MLTRAGGHALPARDGCGACETPARRKCAQCEKAARISQRPHVRDAWVAGTGLTARPTTLDTMTADPLTSSAAPGAEYAGTASAAYRSALEVIESVEPRIAAATRQELADQ